MKAFRIILISIFSLLFAYLLYSAVAYFIWAIKTPDIIGETTTEFGGMYLMSLFALAGAIISIIPIIIIAKKLRNKGKNK